MDDPNNPLGIPEHVTEPHDDTGLTPLTKAQPGEPVDGVEAPVDPDTDLRTTPVAPADDTPSDPNDHDIVPLDPNGVPVVANEGVDQAARDAAATATSVGTVAAHSATSAHARLDRIETAISSHVTRTELLIGLIVAMALVIAFLHH